MTGTRFLTLADLAEVLNISAAQAYALVRTGDLPAVKVGGRGQWRVEAEQVEAYIQRLYAQTASFIADHPFSRAEAHAYGDERQPRATLGPAHAGPATGSAR